jgi:ribonuclease P protein subunit RPR2
VNGTGDREIAAERIDRLAALAERAARGGDTERSQRYVRLARRVAERHRLPLPRRFKRFTCDRCDRYLVPGRNVRVRTRDGHVAYVCECGHVERYPYEGEQGGTEGGGGGGTRSDEG